MCHSIKKPGDDEKHPKNACHMIFEHFRMILMKDEGDIIVKVDNVNNDTFAFDNVCKGEQM